MYHKKKIALFISHIFGYYQKNLCQGVVDQAADYGYQTEIYATMDGENLGNYSIGEDGILQIPNFSEFSGIIFASDTYRNQTLKQQITATLQKKCSCPVIEIAEYQPSFPSISLDNNMTSGSLTEHLISVHHCRRICYLGCSAESFFSDRRENAYRAVMNKHSLPIDPQDVYYSDYSQDSYIQALDAFTRNRTCTPDAVVCYNDKVALQLMITALQAGYHIPDDFALTGCDCSPEGQNVEPPLTTVTFPVYEVGGQAASQLIRLIQNESIPDVTTVFAEPHIAGSCGCSYSRNTHPVLFTDKLMKRIDNVESSIISSMRMSADFSHITNIDEGMEVLEQYISEIENCSEFYLCLYANWNRLPGHILELTEQEDFLAPDEDTLLLKLAIQNGKRLPECSFSRSALLPEYLSQNSDSAYIISPLFFEDRAFGYVALAFRDNVIKYHFQLVHWITNISLLLQNICDSKRTQVLVSHLENIYMKDVLTGLYNHHGYEHYKKQMLAQLTAGTVVAAILFDLDELKTINDHFGHTEGDFALKVIGQALVNASGPDIIATRFGGDEFYVLSHGMTEEEVKDFALRIDTYLNNYNRLSKKPYNISISSGYACTTASARFGETELEQLFQKADSNMYENKRNKIKHVLRD